MHTLDFHDIQRTLPLLKEHMPDKDFLSLLINSVTAIRAYALEVNLKMREFDDLDINFKIQNLYDLPPFKLQ